MKVFAAVLAAMATGVSAQMETVPCTYGPKLNDLYIFSIDGLTATECMVFRIQISRYLHQNHASQLAGIHAGSTAERNLTAAFPGWTEMLANETCPVTMAHPLYGTGCSTWETDNFTHPIGMSGKIPDTHVMALMCMNNHFFGDRVSAAGAPSLCPANMHASMCGSLGALFAGMSNFCKPLVHPVTLVSPLPCNTGVDFGSQSLKCCESAGIQTSALTYGGEDAPLANLSNSFFFCQAHGSGMGCVDDTKMPTEAAIESSASYIQENNCACGSYIMGNLTANNLTYVVSALDADNNGEMDACTTTTTTAAPTTAAATQGDGADATADGSESSSDSSDADSSASDSTETEATTAAADEEESSNAFTVAAASAISFSVVASIF